MLMGKLRHGEAARGARPRHRWSPTFLVLSFSSSMNWSRSPGLLITLKWIFFLVSTRRPSKQTGGKDGDGKGPRHTQGDMEWPPLATPLGTHQPPGRRLPLAMGPLPVGRRRGDGAGARNCSSNTTPIRPCLPLPVATRTSLRALGTHPGAVLLAARLFGHLTHPLPKSRLLGWVRLVPWHGWHGRRGRARLAPGSSEHAAPASKHLQRLSEPCFTAAASRGQVLYRHRGPPVRPRGAARGSRRPSRSTASCPTS